MSTKDYEREISKVHNEIDKIKSDRRKIEDERKKALESWVTFEESYLK